MTALMLKLYITLERQGGPAFPKRLPEERYWNLVFVHLMHPYAGLGSG